MDGAISVTSVADVSYLPLFTSPIVDSISVAGTYQILFEGEPPVS